MKSFCIKSAPIFLILLLGIILYSDTFNCSFHFDDHHSITANFALRDLSNLPSIWGYLPRRFILYLTLAFNYHFNRLDVGGYHLFNLCVHLISAVLVWWLALLTLSTPALKKEITSGHDRLIALLAGLVFVSHPVQTEAVTYIVQRAASLSTLFYLVSLCFYVKARSTNYSEALMPKGAKRAKDPMPFERRMTVSGKIYYIGSILSAIAAMFTKETAITLPLMILLYEFCFFKTKNGFKWAYAVPFLLTILIIPLVMSMTESSPGRVEQLRGEAGISSIHYLLTQFRVIVTYIRLVFLPMDQNLDYDYPVSHSLLELPSILSFLCLIGVLGVTKLLFSRYRLLSFSIFWFFLTLLPESSIFPIKDVIFEHRLYLPLVGFSMFLVAGAYYFWAKRSMTIMLIIFGIIISCNSVLTYQRNKIWRDEFTLWNDASLKSPHKARPYNNRGKNYIDQGNTAQGLLDFKKAIEVDPDYAEAYINRGNIYTSRDDYARALADYNKAIKLNGGFAEAYNNRSYIDGQLGLLNQGLVDCHRALEINPFYPEAYDNCGIIDDKQGNVELAIVDYDKAIELGPDNPDFYYNRGNSYVKQGDLAKAMSDFNRSLELYPKNSGAYNNRGLIFEKQGDLAQAMDDYKKAVELEPKNSEAYNNLGNIENKQGKFDQAILDLNKAIQLNPRSAGAYYNRGSAWGKHGNLSQAVLDLSRAVQIKADYAEAYDNLAVAYFMSKQFDQAWDNVHHAQTIGFNINPGFINALKNASGRDQ